MGFGSQVVDFSVTSPGGITRHSCRIRREASWNLLYCNVESGGSQCDQFCASYPRSWRNICYSPTGSTSCSNLQRCADITYSFLLIATCASFVILLGLIVQW